MQLIFDRVVTKKTPGEFRTRVIQDGVHPSLHIDYKNFDLKQYFKEGRGCRTEGTFRNPKDFGVNKGLTDLPYLQKIGRQINRRLLEVERISHNSGLSGDSIQRVVQPAVTEDGKKAPGLKFGQPRVMALFLTSRYFVTPYGWKVARLFSRLEGRVFRPAMAMFTANDAVLPFPLKCALDRVDAQLDALIYDAFPLPKAG